MQTRQQVFCEIKDHIMLIRVDNPETKNGLDWDGIEQLARSYEELQNNPDVRVGIITGNEQYFYTGGRVDPNAPGEKDKYTDALTHFLKASGAVTKPMIAAVNGDCMKAGMGVLALCDFAVARKGVVFNFPEVRMGGVPMMVLVDIVDAMPRKRALEALLTSWDLSAEEALQMGLVNRVVAKEEFWPTVYRFADAMLATQPWLIDMTKQAYEDMVHLTKENRIFDQRMADLLLMKAPEQTLAYYRHGLVFVFNFHFGNSLNNVLVPVRQPGEYTVVLSTDDEKYGGFGNVAKKTYATKRFDGRDYIELYIPARTGFVLKEKVILPETPAAPKKAAK